MSHLRNLIGKIRGNSGCLNCGGRWNWKKPHFIIYEDMGEASGGMTPLCEECFQSLPVDGVGGIMDFCNQVLTPWIAFQRIKFPPERVNSMLTIMRKNIEAEKKTVIHIALHIKQTLRLVKPR